MCWGTEVTSVMVAAGVAGAALTWHRKDPVAVPVTLLYFALMEGLQLAGYMVIDQCGSPVNRAATLLSVLHIAFQPIFVNAFALAVVAPGIGAAGRKLILSLAALSSALMVAQLLPVEALGQCQIGRPLCGTPLCTVSGEWHQAWNVPYNGLMTWFDTLLGTNLGFPPYVLTVFVMPVFYGAWRFAIFHLLLGPVLAFSLTSNPNEGPAIWCLFSIGILAIALLPAVRRQFRVPTAVST
ncbi:DUF5765 domain-containing protein [Rhodobacter sp. NSM]|uniref:DUF5765 domain-containing protein n=1 Tax=Rhodobacter sp. NSM TaxID=3457501 RepID=UPI003FD1F618